MFHYFLRRNKYHSKPYSKKVKGSEILKNLFKLSEKGKKDMGFEFDATTEGFYKNYQNDPFKEELEDTLEDEDDEYDFEKGKIDDLLEDVAKDLMKNDPSFDKFERLHKEATVEQEEEFHEKDDIFKIDEETKDFKRKQIEIELDLEVLRTFEFFSVDFPKLSDDEMLEYQERLKFDKYDYNKGEWKYTFKKVNNRIQRYKYRVKDVKKKLPRNNEENEESEEIEILTLNKENAVPKTLEDIERLEKYNKNANFEQEKKDIQRYKKIKRFDDEELYESLGKVKKQEEEEDEEEEVEDLNEEGMKKLVKFMKSIPEEEKEEYINKLELRIKKLEQSSRERKKSDQKYYPEDEVFNVIEDLYENNKIEYFQKKYPEFRKEEIELYFEVQEKYPIFLKNIEIEEQFEKEREILETSIPEIGNKLEEIMKKNPEIEKKLIIEIEKQVESEEKEYEKILNEEIDKDKK